MNQGLQIRIAMTAALAAALSGCVGKVITTAIKAPVQVVGKTVDVLTTSQDEADRNRGRKERKAEERRDDR